MDSFIFKGKSSKDFKIIINSLPTISKPPLRVEEIEIDGVDGARYEELGYGCYEKKIKITITEDNIDSLIDWLKGEGDLILSNEPDKYYNAKIIEQIDFERLMKYEPTEIKFRVQPFKYQYQEEKVIAGIGSVEGIEIKISDVKATQLQVDGRSTQDGEPTPDTPVEIVSLGTYNEEIGKYEIEVKTVGKNKCKLNDSQETSNGLITTITNNIISIKGTANTTWFNLTFNQSLTLKAGTYTVSTNKLLSQIGIDFYDNSGWVFSLPQNITYKTFTLSSDKTITRMAGAVANGEVLNINDLMFQIEEGTVASEPTPNQERTSTIVLNTPLKSLPNGVKDIAYIKNNRLYVDRYVGSVVLNGSEDWGLFFNTQGIFFFKPEIPSVAKDNTLNGLSNYFINTTRATIRNNLITVDNLFSIYAQELTIAYKTIATVEEFKTWLSNNNVQVDYELATPLTEEYGDLTILQLVDGENNISNSEDANMIIDYIETLNVSNLGNHTSKPIFEIEGVGKVDFILNNSNVFSYNFDDDGKVVIDSEKEDAYLGLTLKNRNMNGDFPIFNPEENKFTWDGLVKNISVSKKSRWL